MLTNVKCRKWEQYKVAMAIVKVIVWLNNRMNLWLTSPMPTIPSCLEQEAECILVRVELSSCWSASWKFVALRTCLMDLACWNKYWRLVTRLQQRHLARCGWPFTGTIHITVTQGIITINNIIIMAFNKLIHRNSN